MKRLLSLKKDLYPILTMYSKIILLLKSWIQSEKGVGESDSKIALEISYKVEK